MQGSQLKEAYDVMVRAYEALEKSHENYVDPVEEAIRAWTLCEGEQSLSNGRFSFG